MPLPLGATVAIRFNSLGFHADHVVAVVNGGTPCTPPAGQTTVGALAVLRSRPAVWQSPYLSVALSLSASLPLPSVLACLSVGPAVCPQVSLVCTSLRVDAASHISSAMQPTASTFATVTKGTITATSMYLNVSTTVTNTAAAGQQLRFCIKV